MDFITGLFSFGSAVPGRPSEGNAIATLKQLSKEKHDGTVTPDNCRTRVTAAMAAFTGDASPWSVLIDQGDHSGICQLLSLVGDGVTLSNVHAATLLLQASANGWADVVEALFDEAHPHVVRTVKNQIDAQDETHRRTAAGWATTNGHRTIVYTLLRNGAKAGLAERIYAYSCGCVDRQRARRLQTIERQWHQHVFKHCSWKNVLWVLTGAAVLRLTYPPLLSGTISMVSSIAFVLIKGSFYGVSTLTSGAIQGLSKGMSWVSGPTASQVVIWMVVQGVLSGLAYYSNPLRRLRPLINRVSSFNKAAWIHTALLVGFFLTMNGNYYGIHSLPGMLTPIAGSAVQVAWRCRPLVLPMAAAIYRYRKTR